MLKKVFCKVVFCSLCNQVVFNPPMASHVFTYCSLKSYYFVKKTFFFCKLWDTYLEGEKKATDENVEKIIKMLKFTQFIVIDFLIFLSCKKIPKTRIDRRFLTIAHFYEKRKIIEIQSVCTASISLK